MTKLHYQENLSFANSQIQKFKDQIAADTQKYIEANKRFNIGDKIEITTPAHPYWSHSPFRNYNQSEPDGIRPEAKRFAFVDGFEVDFRQNIKYILRVCKKDGGRSKNRDHYIDRDILTLA